MENIHYKRDYDRSCSIENRVYIKFSTTHGEIDPYYNSSNAPDNYPTMHHFVTEMCTQVHISVAKWYIVGYETDALWDLWDWSVRPQVKSKSHVLAMGCLWVFWITLAVHDTVPCVVASSTWSMLHRLLTVVSFSVELFSSPTITHGGAVVLTKKASSKVVLLLSKYSVAFWVSTWCRVSMTSVTSVTLCDVMVVGKVRPLTAAGMTKK